jgi:hypothetical protein
MGRYGEAEPETVKYFRRLVPSAPIAIVEESTGITMLDERSPLPASSVSSSRKLAASVEGTVSDVIRRPPAVRKFATP